MAGMGWGRDVENECDFGPGQLEVPVVLSNGSCYMGLELWGNSGGEVRDTTGLSHHIQAHCSLTSLSTVSKPLSPYLFLGKLLKYYIFKVPTW